MSRTYGVAVSITLLFVLGLHNNCTGNNMQVILQGTTTGNPMVSLSVAPYTYQTQGNDNLSVCIRKLKLKPTDASLSEIQINFSETQMIFLSPKGTDLESLLVPSGSYSQIFLELSDSCNLSTSLKVKNPQGTFSTAQSASLHFTGIVSINSGSKKIIFEVQPIVNNLATVASDTELPVKATQDGGTVSVTQTWVSLTTVNAPAARDHAMSVWTGSKMIVWGGRNGTDLNTGGQYDPVTNTWSATSMTGVPSIRYESVYVWSGSHYVVWSGNSGLPNDGAKYNPLTDTWALISVTSAPNPRHSAAFVWTGTEILVWGGHDTVGWTNSGGRYNPTTDTWTGMNITGAPPAVTFDDHNISAVWTGSEMLVWGGDTGGVFTNTGGRYNPSTNSWSTITTVGAPSARKHFTPVWTGSELLIWGGENGSPFNNGAKYNPTTNTWTPISTIGAPSARGSYAAVWTGTEMIIWGGYNNITELNNGARYNPSTDQWTALSTAGAPTARMGATVIWTGSQMIIWGGTHGGGYLNDGAIFNP